MSKAGNGIAKTKSQGRSRIGNGSTLLPSIDGRSTWARLFRDVYAAMCSHLGGEDRLSESERITVRRISTLEAELSYLEDKFAKARAEDEEPKAVDLDLYTRLANAQRRHLELVGMDRRAKDITPPNIDQWLEHQAKQKATAE